MDSVSKLKRISGSVSRNKFGTFEEYCDYNWNVNLSNDAFFSFLCQEKEYVTRLLEDILGMSIDDIEIVDSQKGFSSYSLDKGKMSSIRYDVYIKTTGKVINVEIQNSHFDLMERRARFYSSVLDVMLCSNTGADKYDLPDSYVIVFYNKFISSDLEPISKYSMINQNGISLNDGRNIIFINYNAVFGDSVTSTVCAGLRNNFDFGNAKHLELLDKMLSIMEDEFKRGVIMTLQEKLDDYKHMFLKQGIEQGIEQGREEGIEIGKERGGEKERYSNILAMVDSGISFYDALRILKVSEEEFRRLERVYGKS